MDKLTVILSIKNGGKGIVAFLKEHPAPADGLYTKIY